MFTPKKLSVATMTAMTTVIITQLSGQVYASQIETVSVVGQKERAQQESVSSASLLTTSNSETGTALRQMSGVDASRMGGHGVDLVIRGQTASQLNILLDGAKIEGGCPNRMDPATAYVEMSSFDQVTVIKGVNSVTYGVGGSGGTVLFERNAPIFEAGKLYRGNVNFGGASNGLTRDMNATVAAGGKQGYIVLQGSKKSADNYLDGNGEEVRSSYESQQGHIDLGWTPNEHHEVRLSYENTRIEDALFQGAMMDSPLSDGTTTRLRYNGSKINDVIQDIAVDIYQSDVNHVMNNFELRPFDPTKKMETVSDAKTTGAKIKLTSMIRHTQLDYGVQFESIEKRATLYNRSMAKSVFNMWPNVLQETKSVFAESTSFFKNQQKFILGLRYDDVTTDAKGANSATEMGNKASNVYQNIYGSNTTKTDDANFNALLRYERTYQNNLTIFTGVSRTHRYPDATELYMARGDWTGNPDLKPEQHTQFDMGLSQATDQIEWSVSAYYDVVNNYILRDKGANQPNRVNVNGQNSVYLNKDATLYGLDLAGSWQATPYIKVGSSLNLTKGTNDTDNRTLSNVAPLSGAAFAEYATSVWKAGARFHFATEQTETNVQYDELETAAWSTLDLYGNYQINKQFALSAGVDNLTDHAYQTYLNRTDSTIGANYKLYEPGRSVWARVNVTF